MKTKKEEESFTNGNSSIVSIIVTVFESVTGSKVKLSLYREKFKARAMDGSSTTNNSPS